MGISIKKHTTECWNCTLRWKVGLYLVDLILSLCFCSSRGEREAAKQPRGQLMTNSCGGRTTGHSLADCWTILRLFYVFYVISWLTFCWLLTQQSSSFKRRNAAPPAQCFPYAPSAPASHTHTFCHLFGVFLNFTVWREGWNIFIWENERSHWLRQVHELGEQTHVHEVCVEATECSTSVCLHKQSPSVKSLQRATLHKPMP